MAFRLWMKNGKIIANVDGEPYSRQACPCDAICDDCCYPQLLDQYTLTLSSGFTFSTCAGDVSIPTSFTVDYMGTGDGTYCVWTSDTTVILDGGGDPSGWYYGALIQYDPVQGYIYPQVVVLDSPDMAALYSTRWCYTGYPYNCATVTAVTSVCVSQWDNSAGGPDFCSDAFSLSGIPWTTNGASSCSPCSGGTGTTVTIT